MRVKTRTCELRVSRAYLIFFSSPSPDECARLYFYRVRTSRVISYVYGAHTYRVRRVVRKWKLDTCTRDGDGACGFFKKRKVLVRYATGRGLRGWNGRDRVTKSPARRVVVKRKRNRRRVRCTLHNMLMCASGIYGPGRLYERLPVPRAAGTCARTRGCDVTTCTRGISPVPRLRGGGGPGCANISRAPAEGSQIEELSNCIVNKAVLGSGGASSGLPLACSTLRRGAVVVVLLTQRPPES